MQKEIKKRAILIGTIAFIVATLIAACMVLFAGGAVRYRVYAYIQGNNLEKNQITFVESDIEPKNEISILDYEGIVPMFLPDYELNPVVQELRNRYPAAGATFLMYARTAQTWTETFFGNRNAHLCSGDAFRHAFWNALMARSSMGYDLAQRFATAHETNHWCAVRNQYIIPDTQDARMDLINNALGRHNGLRHPNTSISHLAHLIVRYVSRGHTSNFTYPVERLPGLQGTVVRYVRLVGGRLVAAGTDGLFRNFIDMPLPLELTVVQRFGVAPFNWDIRFTNRNSFQVKATYNYRMAFQNDARFHTNLRHLRTVTIPANSSIVRRINSNAAAGWITTSINYVRYNTNFRLISATNGLHRYGANPKEVMAQPVGARGFTVRVWNGDQQIDDFYHSFGQTRNIAAPSRSGHTFSHWSVVGGLRPGRHDANPLVINNSFATTNSSNIIIDIHAQFTENTCVATGTLITLADGRQKPVEDLLGDEHLLVWNFFTGSFDSVPILFIEKGGTYKYNTAVLNFCTGDSVRIIDAHAFFNITLNKYVRVTTYNVSEFFGHYFLGHALNGDKEKDITHKQLVGAVVEYYTTEAFNPIVPTHFAFFANGLLSAPGAFVRVGFLNIFEINAETLAICYYSYSARISEIGLLSFEEFQKVFPIVPIEVFYAFNGKYINIAKAAGNMTMDGLQILIGAFLIHLL